MVPQQRGSERPSVAGVKYCRGAVVLKLRHRIEIDWRIRARERGRLRVIEVAAIIAKLRSNGPISGYQSVSPRFCSSMFYILSPRQLAPYWYVVL